MTKLETPTIDDAIKTAGKLFRQVALDINLQRVVRGEMPSAQAGIYADMAASAFEVKLYDALYGHGPQTQTAPPMKAGPR